MLFYFLIESFFIGSSKICLNLLMFTNYSVIHIFIVSFKICLNLFVFTNLPIKLLFFAQEFLVHALNLTVPNIDFVLDPRLELIFPSDKLLFNVLDLTILK